MDTRSIRDALDAKGETGDEVRARLAKDQTYWRPDEFPFHQRLADCAGDTFQLGIDEDVSALYVMAGCLAALSQSAATQLKKHGELPPPVDWKTLRELAVRGCSNGSGFALITEDSWRELAKLLAARGQG